MKAPIQKTVRFKEVEKFLRYVEKFRKRARERGIRTVTRRRGDRRFLCIYAPDGHVARISMPWPDDPYLRCEEVADLIAVWRDFLGEEAPPDLIRNLRPYVAAARKLRE